MASHNHRSDRYFKSSIAPSPSIEFSTEFDSRPWLASQKCHLVEMLKELIDFIFPSSCGICGRKPAILCEPCKPDAEAGKFSHEQVQGSYVFDYAALAPVLSDYKDKSMVAHSRYLGMQLSPLLEDLFATKHFEGIVIAGSSRLNFKRRGFIPSKLILKRCPAVKKSGLKVTVLARTRMTQEQRTLGSKERRANVSNSMTASHLSGKRVLLFDDVFTTGSTMSEMIRAVESAGGAPHYFCVLAKRI